MREVEVTDGFELRGKKGKALLLGAQDVLQGDFAAGVGILCLCDLGVGQGDEVGFDLIRESRPLGHFLIVGVGLGADAAVEGIYFSGEALMTGVGGEDVAGVVVVIGEGDFESDADDLLGLDAIGRVLGTSKTGEDSGFEVVADSGSFEVLGSARAFCAQLGGLEVGPSNGSDEHRRKAGFGEGLGGDESAIGRQAQDGFEGGEGKLGSDGNLLGTIRKAGGFQKSGAGFEEGGFTLFRGLDDEVGELSGVGFLFLDEGLFLSKGEDLGEGGASFADELAFDIADLGGCGLHENL